MTTPISKYDDLFQNLNRELDSIDSNYKKNSKNEILDKGNRIFNIFLKFNPYVVIGLSFLVVNIILFSTKPKYILKLDSKTKKPTNKVDLAKCVLYSFLIIIPIILFYFLKFKLVIS